MQTAVAKWGNSLALRLPKRLADELRIGEGTRVELSVRNAALIVAPSRPRYRLDELLARMPKKAKIHPETDWGNAVGSEVW